jgi:regulator of sirC expression with transglutaminase-like and TPR domain
MDDVPNEILRHILFFLTNDGIAVGRLALCSSTLHKRVMEQSLDVWEALVRNRWRRGLRLPTDSLEENDCHFQREYIGRHQIDTAAVHLLKKITRYLQSILHLTDETLTMDGSCHVGQAWDHPCWPYFLKQGSELLDVLHDKAQPVPALMVESNGTDVDSDGSAPTRNDERTGVFNRLFRFLAARSFQNVHFADCLMEWKRLHHIEQIAPLNFNSTAKEHLESAQRLEKWAFLVCRIQQTPLEVLKENYMDVKQRAVQLLDEIADACRTKIAEISQPYSSGPPSNMAKMKIVLSVLTDDYGFLGNEADYYNYHNSLLDRVLESKMGSPMTLCILYACICRRLDIPVYLIGLPGRMVLGFDNDDDADFSGSSTIHRHEKRIYIDVFHGGQFLSIDDCQELAASYGFPWHLVNTNPLRNEVALKRILANLNSCHPQSNARRSPFHSDLVFQIRALESICDQPPAISEFLVDRIAQELPITLSQGLLRAYGLLSSVDNFPQVAVD